MLFWQVSPGPSSGRLTGKSSIGSLAGGCTMERLYITIFLLKQIQPLRHRCCKKRLHPDNDSRPCLGSPELVHYMLDTPQAWPIQYFYSSVEIQFVDQGKSGICFDLKERNQIPDHVLGL